MRVPRFFVLFRFVLSVCFRLDVTLNLSRTVILLPRTELHIIMLKVAVRRPCHP